MHGAWLGDLWTTLAGRPHLPVPSEDGVTLKQREIAPDEQLIGYFEQHPVPLVADGIDLASPAALYLGANGVSLLVPLVTQGRLVGLLSLGEPAGRGSYSRDDLAFLTTLADEAAPAASARWPVLDLLEFLGPHQHDVEIVDKVLRCGGTSACLARAANRPQGSPPRCHTSSTWLQPQDSAIVLRACQHLHRPIHPDLPGGWVGTSRTESNQRCNPVPTSRCR